MFDVLRIKISTMFMKGFIAKAASKKIYEKYGCKVNIRFNDIDVDTFCGDVIIHVDADIQVDRSELERILDEIN